MLAQAEMIEYEIYNKSSYNFMCHSVVLLFMDYISRNWFCRASRSKSPKCV